MNDRLHRPLGRSVPARPGADAGHPRPRTRERQRATGACRAYPARHHAFRARHPRRHGQDPSGDRDKSARSPMRLRSLATLSTQETHSLSASAHEASLNAQSVASAAEQLHASVNAIFAQIERSSATAALAAKNAEEATTTVDELDGAVAKIGKVVALINDIAEQTSLLALNATIESARARARAGRGFGVVAAEVKTLAQQTSSATGDIQQQIATRAECRARCGQCHPCVRDDHCAKPTKRSARSPRRCVSRIHRRATSPKACMSGTKR